MCRNVSSEEPRYFTIRLTPDRTAYRLSPPRASAKRPARDRLALRLPVRHGLRPKRAPSTPRPSASGSALLRFDYSGHGRSDGRLEEGTISRWLAETLAIVQAETEGPQIVVGSSMGGWLALLAARALIGPARSGRLAGLILIAPAVDFTEALLWERAPEAARRAIMEEGAWRPPSAYSDEPDVFTRALIEDGRTPLLLGGMIRTHCPVAVMQGMQDEAVPYTHALALMERLGGDAATLTLVKDGDHRLSRPQDLALLFATLERMRAAAVETASLRPVAVQGRAMRLEPRLGAVDVGRERGAEGSRTSANG